MTQKIYIPNEWYLGTEPRYQRQNMERAMRGQIERGLIELITNADDSYRDLEEYGKQVAGKIRIEIDRKRKGQPSIVIVRDRAAGMDRVEMYNKLGTLGRRTSGFEKGKARRGLHGRGARDIAAFGTVHFKSIKNEEYNHLIVPPSLECRFTEPTEKKASQEIRQKLGIPKGNGTVITIEVDKRFKLPLHETLRKNFPQYYSLRDVFSNPKREVILVDLNKDSEDTLRYKYTIGECIFDEVVMIPNFPGVTTHLIICKHDTAFEQDNLPYREGILVKSSAAIHDCTYFGFESEPFSWRFTGESHCEYIDNLIREYDDREEENPDDPNHPIDNPKRLLDPFRDGLILDHPFILKLYEVSRRILQPFIEELKATESPPKRDVVSEQLNRKLGDLSKEISKSFEKKVKELEEDIPSGSTNNGAIEKLPIGLHIIPPEEHPVVVNEPKTFSIIIKHYEELRESLPIDVISSDANVKVRTSPVWFKKLMEDGKVGTTTFTVESSKVGTEAFIEARYAGYDNLVLVRIVDSPTPPDVPAGLSFDKPLFHTSINKEKELTIWLKTTAKLGERVIVQITSNHSEIVVKGGGVSQLRETNTPGLFVGKCKILGRQLKARGIITARVEGFETAQTEVIVEKREFISGISFDFRPVEEDFHWVRYKWDETNPYLLLIGAKHPAVRKYLGDPTGDWYPGIDSPLYHAVLAEIIAEALAFRLLEIQFNREGQGGMLDYTATDAYYHKDFSEFLTITHKRLVEEP